MILCSLVITVKADCKNPDKLQRAFYRCLHEQRDYDPIKMKKLDKNMRECMEDEEQGSFYVDCALNSIKKCLNGAEKVAFYDMEECADQVKNCHPKSAGIAFTFQI